jgi:hypothetical protein
VKKVDRSRWARGPWDDEPDRVEFVTEAGFPAIIRRVPSGHLCGYVAVPPGHPAHGKTYGRTWETDEKGETDFDRPVPNVVEDLVVHGGITYAEPCDHDVGVCHVPAPGESDDVWWLGFDAAHGGDVSPAYSSGYGSYRTVAYMRDECESLAKQLAALVVP